MDPSAPRLRRLLSLGGLLLAGFLLFPAVRRAEWEHVADTFAAASPLVLSGCVVLEAIVQGAKAWKWTVFARVLGPVRYGDALRGVLIGAAMSHLVPLRVDELTRGAVLARRASLPLPAVLGTVALDRLLDAAVLAAAVAVLILTGAPRQVAGALGALAVVLVAGLAIVLILPRWKLGGRLAAPLSALRDGLRAWPRGRAIGAVLAATAIEWAASIATYALLLSAAGVPSLDAAAALAVAGAAAYAIPGPPGALGTYEGVMSSLAVQLLALTEGAALGLALLAHAILWVPATVVGLLLVVFDAAKGGESRR